VQYVTKQLVRSGAIETRPHGSLMAMEFLRFRKGHPGYEGYEQGDLERIKAQQDCGDGPFNCNRIVGTDLLIAIIK